MSDGYDGKVNGEVVLNLADWIERRRDAVGPYADHIIHSVRAHEGEISRLRAEVERLNTLLSTPLYSRRKLEQDLAEERRHADVLAQALANVEYMSRSHASDDLLAQHRARRQGDAPP